jgi:hypothetical protein
MFAVSTLMLGMIGEKIMRIVKKKKKKKTNEVVVIVPTAIATVVRIGWRHGRLEP